MTLQVKKIRLNELENFVISNEFQEYEMVPISPIRAQSYLANPHAHPDDTVLYLGFINEKLVAFRSIFADTLSDNNETIRFGWCSGNWVYEQHRRNGYSGQLLREAYNDWDKKLAFTNYAPNSEKLYLKTGLFHSIHQFEGARLYLYAKTTKLFQSKINPITAVLFKITDFFISLWVQFISLFYRSKPVSTVSFSDTEQPDKSCFEFLQSNPVNSFFNRDELELKWIFEHPWLSQQNNSEATRYPFSSFAENFYYKTVKVKRADKMLGFFIFSVREGHLKTLYFNLTEDCTKEITVFLKKYCLSNKIEYLTIYKKELAGQLLSRKFPFLHAKRYGQKIYSTFQVSNKKQHTFQDGDGDVFFT
ncbi:GNAT family N-acetyltransferase [uncultured Draconibacterium sp.]|uniref:GNAT family N-acetyltransferase n=1 Tax=uncultured Draconibacterium sp. TaxID=1573823 RepID=UPI002AA60543|nr:GNAT family N-acetyltransferase [uncultured Draconibacterium sp.]